EERLCPAQPSVPSKMTAFAPADPGAGAVLALALGPAIAGNARKAIPSAPTRSKSRRLQRELQAVGQVRWKANGTRPMNTYSGKGGIVSADEPDCKKLPTYLSVSFLRFGGPAFILRSRGASHSCLEGEVMKKAGVAVVIFLVVAGIAVAILWL